MLLWVTVGRWIYSEAELSAPALVPVFDSILEVVQIPTHDQWSLEGADAVYGEVRRFFRESARGADAVEVLNRRPIEARRDFEVF